MELDKGEKLGPYEIQHKLGAGGMGVVYRAIDSRLGRAVAIKVLPIALAGDPERLKRFEREARTIGSLNHPNLVTLFDVGHHEGVPFLVTELLEGKSLREKLAMNVNRRFAIREAVRVASEIARGLAAAHGAGITHRDIKPDNIFVIDDDRVKILDFGIAKLTHDDTIPDDAGNAATLAGVAPAKQQETSETGTGMVIGTPGYMAPEQLAAGAVGPRTDIFALGVVLYEMLAGRRPFAADTGEAAVSSIEESYAILKQAPPELPTNVPSAIARVVRRCLEKRPEARFQSASDLAFALGDIESSGSQAYSKAHETAIAATTAQRAIVVAGIGTESSGVPAVGGAVTGMGVGVVGARVKTLPGPAVVPAEEAPETAAVEESTGAGPRISTQRSGRVEAAQVAIVASGTPSGAMPVVAAPARAALGPWILGSVLVAAIAGLGAMWLVKRGGTVEAASASAGGVHAVAAAGKGAAGWLSLADGGPEYHRVSWLPQSAIYARFDNEETGVLWSLRKVDTNLWHVMKSDIEDPSLTELPMVGRVLDVSGTGEIALRTKGTGEGGTLERGRPGMGKPQFVADHVEEAAWAADNDSFAILRAQGDRSATLEYPIGKTVFRPKSGSLGLLRISHTGFLGVVQTDGPPLYGSGSSGVVTILAAGGEVVAQSAAYGHIDGLAWSGDELWFSEGTTLRALSRDGKERVLVRSVLPIGLRDIAKDGRILAAPRQMRTRTMIGPMGGKVTEFTNVGWFDGSEVSGMSADGKTIVFIETTGTRDAKGYPAFRRTGNEQPTSIGHAFGVALLPDASATFAITGVATPPRLIPADAVAPVDLPLGDIAQFDIADRPAVSWSGKWAVVRAAAKGGKMRLWRYDLEHPTVAPVAVGPPGLEGELHPISSDGEWIAIADRGKGIALIPTAPGAATQQIAIDAAQAAKNDDEHTPLAFTADDTGIVLAAMHGYPRKVERFDRTTKERTEMAVIAPEEKPDALSIVVDKDGTTLGYSMVIETSEIYVLQPPAKPVAGAASPP